MALRLGNLPAEAYLQFSWQFCAEFRRQTYELGLSAKMVRTDVRCLYLFYERMLCPTSCQIHHMARMPMREEEGLWLPMANETCHSRAASGTG